MEDFSEDFPLADCDGCVELHTMCNRVCREMVQHCMNLGGIYAEPNLLRLLTDSADVCDLYVKFIISRSQFIDDLARVAIEVLKTCAEKCESMDIEMEACGEVCKECYKYSEKLLNQNDGGA